MTTLLILAMSVPVAASGAPYGGAPRPGEARKFVVTLDAGHGGHDVGAVGLHANEKNLTLAVVKKLGALIRKHLGEDVKVVYTRDGDYFVTLDGRASKANNAKSDLFVSVHINSVAKSAKNRTTVEGCQVYTLGLHKTAENLAVAKRENAVMELEGDNNARYAGFDPNSLESDIVFELSQSKRLDQSIEFADAVHTELIETAGRSPKGVRQAGFWVLWATSMPAVLIELDFICNPRSEDYLSSENGQDEMARAIYNAFCAYFNTYGSQVVGHKVEAKRICKPLKRNTSDTQGKRSASEDRNPADYSSKPSPALKDACKPIPDGEGTSEKPYYRIQLAASGRPFGKHAPELQGYSDAEYYFEGGLYKYTVGPYSSEKKARKSLEKIRKDFPDAFIIVVEYGKRVGMIGD